MSITAQPGTVEESKGKLATPEERLAVQAGMLTKLLLETTGWNSPTAITLRSAIKTSLRLIMTNPKVEPETFIEGIVRGFTMAHGAFPMISEAFRALRSCGFPPELEPRLTWFDLDDAPKHEPGFTFFDANSRLVAENQNGTIVINSLLKIARERKAAKNSRIDKAN